MEARQKSILERLTRVEASVSKGKGKAKKQRACWLKAITINYKVAILIINNFNVAAPQAAKSESKKARSAPKPVVNRGSDEARSHGANKNLGDSAHNKSPRGDGASRNPVGREW